MRALIFTPKVPQYGWGFVGSWWTGASDQSQEGLFKWCTTERETNVTNLEFATGKPSGKSSDNCIKYDVTTTGHSFADIDCNLNNRYICEVCAFPAQI
jgi:Lectin C-type domain